MIVDYLKNLSAYPQLAVYEKEIKDFVRRLEAEALPEGRYELKGEELFALVQKYETKEKAGARMESHKKYADLQYIHRGTEVIYMDFTENLTVFEDRTPEADILFYEIQEDLGQNVLREGMFGYYAPQDAHMPCISHHEKEPVVKVVFKILV